MSPGRYLALIDTMARLSLKADARRFALGYLWWILEPLLYVAVFYLVFFHVLGTRTPDFLMFLTVGKLTFIWFSKSVTQASQAIVNARGLIARADLPKLLFPLAVLHEGLYKQFVVFALLLVFLWLGGIVPTLQWLALLPLILVQYLIITACALLAALLVCWQRDFTPLISLGMVFMLFVSGVFWDVNAVSDPGARELVLVLNPLAFLLDSYREVLLRGGLPDWAHLSGIAVAAALLLGLLWLAYGRWSRVIARRVIAA